MQIWKRLDGKRRFRLSDAAAKVSVAESRRELESDTDELVEKLQKMQEALSVARSHAVLVVLQGRDASGKDGVIRKVLGRLNAQSCSVAGFVAPTPVELAHDFLWRVHAQVPALGTIRIFNRSHYEDVLAARVRSLAPAATWRKRYGHINAFERLLADSNVIVIKIFLHVSRAEQKHRLLERASDPLKAWKVSEQDWRDRAKWNPYTHAYEDMIARCSSPALPWHVVPADHKAARNHAVAGILVSALRPYEERWRRAARKPGIPERTPVKRKDESERDGLGLFE